jgi:predicted GNAT superfamily acetyltransferase
MRIRTLTPADYDWVLALSGENEVETSHIDRAWLEAAAQDWFLGLARGDGEAFAIIFDQDARYDSVNFLWHRQRADRFVYVDRIVVAAAARGKGHARALYEHVFAAALRAGHRRVLCEVNFDPPNPASEAFHASMGFLEVGRARLANGKTVRYLSRELD